MTPFQAYVAGAVAASLWDLRSSCDVNFEPITEDTEEPVVKVVSRKTGEEVHVRVVRA